MIDRLSSEMKHANGFVSYSLDDDTWWMVLDGFSLSKKKVYFYLYFPKLFL